MELNEEEFFERKPPSRTLGVFHGSGEVHRSQRPVERGEMMFLDHGFGKRFGDVANERKNGVNEPPEVFRGHPSRLGIYGDDPTTVDVGGARHLLKPRGLHLDTLSRKTNLAGHAERIALMDGIRNERLTKPNAGERPGVILKLDRRDMEATEAISELLERDDASGDVDRFIERAEGGLHGDDRRAILIMCGECEEEVDDALNTQTPQLFCGFRTDELKLFDGGAERERHGTTISR